MHSPRGRAAYPAACIPHARIAAFDSHFRRGRCRGEERTKMARRMIIHASLPCFLQTWCRWRSQTAVRSSVDRTWHLHGPRRARYVTTKGQVIGGPCPTTVMSTEFALLGWTANVLARVVSIFRTRLSHRRHCRSKFHFMSS
jgi:hypothetical protein